MNYAFPITGFFSRTLLLAAIAMPMVFSFTECRAQDPIIFKGLELSIPNYANSGSRKIVDDELVFTGDRSNFSMDTDIAGRKYGDVSIRTQFVNSGSDFVGFYVRSTLEGELGHPSTGHQLFAHIGSSGNIRTGQLVDGNIKYFQPPLRTGIDVVNKEVLLQLDLFNEQMTLTAWPAGTEIPPPQISVDLSSNSDLVSEGRVGIWTFQQDSSLKSVTFQSLTVVPEPSGCLQAVVFLGFCLTRARSRRRRC